MSYYRDNYLLYWAGMEGSVDEDFDTSSMDEIGEEHEAILFIANVDEYDSFKVVVFEHEKEEPHFHVYDKKTKRKICFKINKPEYLKHDKYIDEMSVGERERLQKWLALPNDCCWQDSGVIESNYKTICLLWNRNNRDNKVNVDQPIPDYVHTKN